MAGFVIIMQHVAHDFIPLKELPLVVEAKDWPRGFATAVFAFEGDMGGYYFPSLFRMKRR